MMLWLQARLLRCLIFHPTSAIRRQVPHLGTTVSRDLMKHLLEHPQLQTRPEVVAEQAFREGSLLLQTTITNLPQSTSREQTAYEVFQQDGLAHGVRKQVQTGDQPELEASSFEPVPDVVPRNDANSFMPVPMTISAAAAALIQFKPQEPDAMVVAAQTIDIEAIASQKREAAAKRKREERENCKRKAGEGDVQAVADLAALRERRQSDWLKPGGGKDKRKTQ
jgi:hypothetical protein